MKKYSIILLQACLFLACVCTSCDYREYADADYPDTKVYQPMATETVWHINKADDDNVSMVTPGAPGRYILDKANNKFIVLMGVVQSGVSLKSFSVDISADDARINELLAEGGILPEGTQLLPASDYSLPTSVQLSSKNQSASFQLEIELGALTGENLGKIVAVAVKISSSSVEVSEGLGTSVICIDTAFLEELL